MDVVVGGTFDHIHKGHKLLIDTALQTAGENGFVFIGITSGPLISYKKRIKSFENRKRQVEHYLKDKDFNCRVQIESIFTVFGPTLTLDFDAIIISPETEKNARMINHERIRKGLKEMKIIKIPYVLSDDGLPISSTRIRNGVIDEEGHLIRKNEDGD